MERLLARGILLAAVCGLGLGLIASGVIISFLPNPGELSNAQVMERARSLGMQQLSELPLGVRPSVYIWVTPDLSYVEVGQMLHESGLIPNAESLKLRAETLGFVSGLTEGSHLIRSGDSIDQILAKISRKQ